MKNININNDDSEAELNLLLQIEDLVQSLYPIKREERVNKIKTVDISKLKSEYSAYIKFNDEINYLCDLDTSDYEIKLSSEFPAVSFISSDGTKSFTIFIKHKNDRK